LLHSTFADHVAFLGQLLERRQEVVARIERQLLNVRDKDTARRRDRSYFERTFDTCVFGLPGLPPERTRLKGQLAARHLADGFEPVAGEDQFVNELDPLELIPRAYEYWTRHRWPGTSGRLSYARNLFAVFMLRQLDRLSLRIWDEGDDAASERLRDIQRLLDRLNEPAGSTVFVRDAAWLIHIAQGPLTKHLKPYLTIADRIAASFPESRRLGLHKAGARLAGGHLRSQLRYRVWQTGRPADDPENLAFTRNSNALDGSLLVRDLVPLLRAYQTACLEPDAEERLDLADAILQGLSADPELYLVRLDLLTPYVMIEDLFTERDEEGVRDTAMGHVQRRVITEYAGLIGRLAEPLRQDAEIFDPARGAYSPQGITYGFCADMLSNMAQDVLLAHPSLGLSLEDMFVSRGALDHKLARAKGWEALPRRAGEREHFDHSAEVAADSHARLLAALAARALYPMRPNASARASARLWVVTESASTEVVSSERVPDGAVPVEEYCVTSDLTRTSSGAAVFYTRDQLMVDRKEARFLASAESHDEWFAISKAVLTLFTAQGTDTVARGVPTAVVDVLRLTCPEVLTVSGRGRIDSP
jgi:hypothetical protein